MARLYHGRGLSVQVKLNDFKLLGPLEEGKMGASEIRRTLLRSLL